MSQTLDICCHSCIKNLKMLMIIKSSSLPSERCTLYTGWTWIDRDMGQTLGSQQSQKSRADTHLVVRPQNLRYLYIWKSLSVPTGNWRDRQKRAWFDRVIALSKFTLGQAYFFFQNIDYISVKSRSNTDRVGDSGTYYDVLNGHIYSGRHQYHNYISHV